MSIIPQKIKIKKNKKSCNGMWSICRDFLGTAGECFTEEAIFRAVAGKMGSYSNLRKMRRAF